MGTVAYNTTTKEYVVAWFNRSPSAGQVYGVALNGADGAQIGGLRILSNVYAAYDALDIDYNPPSNQFLLVTHSQTHEDAAVSIKSDVTAYDNGFLATNTADFRAVLQGDGNFNPMMAASTVEKKWLIVTSSKFVSTAAQFVGTNASGGPGASGETAAPPKQAPVVKTHPVSVVTRNAIKNQLVTFSAAATGTPTPTVKWQVLNVGSSSWIDIDGATTASYSFWASPRDNNKRFRAVFTNPHDSTESFAAGIHVAGIRTTDFDGDGQGDLLVWRATTGTWYWTNSSTGFSDGGSKQFGNASLGDVPLAGDIDGDGRADAIVWRASTGTWYWATSSSGFTNGNSRQWGSQALGDIPMLGDMDGDGRSDLVVWRASSGVWYWVTSSSGYANGFGRQWGAQSLGDIPLLGDFDGDGKADPAVWRATSATWYWLTSSSGLRSGFQLDFGSNALGDKPMVADVDGDGTSDLVIWRQSTGGWFWRGSVFGFADGGSVAAFLAPAVGDKPMLSDLDGDGHADFIQFRPSDGMWHWRLSSAFYSAAAGGSKNWGSSALGDIPLIK